jgi:hypothetical protein
MIETPRLRAEFAELVLALVRSYGADRQDLSELVAELPPRPPRRRGRKANADDPAVVRRLARRLSRDDTISVSAAARDAARQMAGQQSEDAAVARLSRKVKAEIKRRQAMRPGDRWMTERPWARALDALACVTDEGDPI